MNFPPRPHNLLLLISAWMISAVGSIAAAQETQLEVASPKPVLINDLAASHPASAYVNESTLAIAEVDWTKLDLNALFGLIQKLTGDRPESIPPIEAFFEKLRHGQAGKIYAIAGPEFLNEGVPLLVIPTAKPQPLADSLKPMLNDAVAVARAGNAILIGDPKQLERCQTFVPSSRNELFSPLQDAKRLDHTLVLAIPDAMRAMLGKLWPDQPPVGLPESVSPQQMVTDISRVVFSVRTPPKLLVNVSIDTADPPSADRVRSAINDIKQNDAQVWEQVTIEHSQRQIRLQADDHLVELLQTIATKARDAERQRTLVDTLRQLGLATHLYVGREQHLPPRCFVDPDGKPLHSWIVALMPDFEQLALYRTIRLDRAWDDPANSLLKTITLKGLGDSRLPPTFTTIRAPVFPGSVWQGDGPPKTLQQITDGTGDTILLIDAPPTAAIHWADPTPWQISTEDPIADVFGDRDRVRVLFVDGSVRLLLRSETTAESLKSMLTYAGKD
ncbi:DUF1559 domain-containing protein [Stieleria sp. TO1_6]|uniref:DUF1559 family PulG-like putative transporter n=1 Tax=Stieleria tagensis TaxID=2956795 RepID=UPI00209B824B|nr:DUF1559 domain-containing protein [Stieleria tagensis]MCO8124689.1 DUF1559 domain-containing protein [Stieleria tagensis]